MKLLKTSGLPAAGRFDQFGVMSTGPLIVQETHYDPWGVELSGLGYQYGGIKVNPYLYQSKEFEKEFGLNLFDFHARGYDPAIGRTWQQDPHAESYYDLSPYSWVGNNPINVIDPTGMDTVHINNVNMDTFDPDSDVIDLDEVVVSANTQTNEPADATKENIPIWLLERGDKVLGHRDGVPGLEDFFGHGTFGPWDVNAEGRILGATPTTGVAPDIGKGARSKKSEILSGKRKLSLAMIRKLYEKLNIPAEVLIKEY